MERNPILLGLAAAAIAYITFEIFKVMLDGLLTGLVLDAFSNLPWLLGGFITGYKSKIYPLKNGAITGAFYGLILCLIAIALASAQTYGVQEKISQLGFAAVATLKLSFMFSLASAFGHVQKLPRAAL